MKRRIALPTFRFAVQAEISFFTLEKAGVHQKQFKMADSLSA
jgi:hypothetical protein